MKWSIQLGIISVGLVLSSVNFGKSFRDIAKEQAQERAEARAKGGGIYIGLSDREEQLLAKAQKGVQAKMQAEAEKRKAQADLARTDYYRELEISPNATTRQIEEAGKKKLAQLRSVRQSGALAGAKMVSKQAQADAWDAIYTRAKQAYDVLRDPVKRKEYDQLRAGKQSTIVGSARSERQQEKTSKRTAQTKRRKARRKKQ